jgi:hypothetical protein
MKMENIRNNPAKSEALLKINVDEIVSTSEKQDCLHFHFILKDLVQSNLESNNLDIASAYLLLNDITSMSFDHNIFSLGYVPMWSGPDGRTATIDDITDLDLQILENLILNLKNLPLKARISDVLWQRKKHNKWAEIAVESYFEIAKQKEDIDNWVDCYENFQRALLIANRTHYDNLNKIIEEIEKVIERYKDDDERFLIMRLVDLLLEIRKGDTENHANIMEHLSILSEKNLKYYISVQRWDIASKCWQRLNKIENKRRADLSAVEVLIKESKSQEEKEAFFEATTSLSQAYQRLKKIGNSDELRKQVNQDLVRLQVESKKFMQTFSEEIDVSEIIRGITDRIKGKTLREALIGFALNITVPNVENLREQVIGHLKDFPLSNLFKQLIKDDKGRTVGVLPYVDINNPEESETAIYMRMIRDASFTDTFSVGPCIKTMLKIIDEEHVISFDDINTIISNNPLIPPDRERIFSMGFLAGFKGDYLSANSLLIPQLENSLRYILECMGFNTSTFNKMNPEIQEDLNLGDLLHEFKEQLQNFFGKDLYFDINHVFNEKISFNLRNDFSHGKLSYNDFYSDKSIYGWWLLWRICVLCHIFIMNYKNQEKDSSKDDNTKSDEP